MKHLLILLSIFLLSSPVIGQSERPETIIVPVSSMGDVSDTRKQILQNTLEDELKTHFRLVPQQRFEEVQEKVFEELEYQECTEDQCIMMIQEMLQVENVFHLQVIGEGSDTQLSLGWRTLDEKKKETDICLKCGTFQLNDKVRGLVEKLVGGKKFDQENVGVFKILNIRSGDIIKINDKTYGSEKRSLTLSLRSGSYIISMKRENYVDENRKYNLIAGKEIIVDLNTLIPLGEIEFSNIQSQDQVKIDNKPISIKTSRSSGVTYKGGILTVRLKKGGHKLNLSRKGYKDKSIKLQVDDGKRYNADMNKLVPLKGILNVKINVDSQLKITGGEYMKSSITKNVSDEIEIDLPIGSYTYLSQNKYYDQKSETFVIREDHRTYLKIELNPLPATLSLTLDSDSKTDESWFRIMGLIQAEEDHFGIYLNGNLNTHHLGFKRTELSLDHGEYEFGVKHVSGKYKDHNGSVSLSPGKLTNVDITLEPSEQFLKHSEWHSKMDKLILATAGSFLISYMSYSAYTEASSKKNEYEAKINDSSNPDMQDTYYEKTNSEIEKMKTASANALLFSLVGLGFSGWTYWTWTEQPERSDPINFSFNSSPVNHLWLTYKYDF